MLTELILLLFMLLFGVEAEEEENKLRQVIMNYATESYKGYIRRRPLVELITDWPTHMMRSTRRSKDRIEWTIAHRSNDFCLALLKTFPDHQNVFFSPASIYVALGMLYAGANYSTADVMKRVLRYDDIDLGDDTIHHSFGSLLNLLNGGSDEYKLEIANVLLYQRNECLSPHFQETLQNNYRALLKEVDFESDNTTALQEINQWVKEKTNEKIPKLLDDLPPNAVMVLLNAIYFKGIWKNTFDPKNTRNADFYNDGVDKIPVSMMHIEQKFPYAWLPEKELEAVELPYKGEHISMVILLPLAKSKLKELEENLNTDSLNDIISDFDPIKVKVYIPKFKLEDSRRLKSNLTYLGLGNLFNQAADFSSINNETNLYVSDVFHKAKIEVNEEGSEAAAVTGIVKVEYSAKPIFYADHPFLFFIRDRRTNLILFAGRVTRL